MMEKIHLRKIRRSDFPHFLRWWRDEELVKLTSGILEKDKKVLEGYFLNMLSSKKDIHYIIQYNLKMVGNISLTHKNKGNFEIHIVIGEKKYWGKGIGAISIQKVLKTAFNKLGYKKAYIEVRPENKRAIELYEFCGFKKMGLKEYPQNKHQPEVLMMELLKKDYLSNSFSNMKSDVSKVNITTKRLLLKNISMKYKKDIFNNFNKEVATYLVPQPSNNIADTEKFIKESIENKTVLELVITDNKSGEFLGCTGINKINTGNPSLGIWLKLPAQGKGIGLETVTAIKKWVDKNLEYKYIRYSVDLRNIASRKIVELLGGTKSKYFNATNSKGKHFRAVEYRIYKK